MFTIIIDGYNFIFNSYFKAGFKSDELQKLRDGTINFLSKYYNVKRNKVIVVFDGYNTDEPCESKYFRQNIEVIYSKKDEKADDVIVRLAKAADNSVIVSNDNDIKRRASGANCSCMEVEEFRRLAETIISGENADGGACGGYILNAEEGEEDGTSGRRAGGGKKGNPRRLSKKERIKIKKIRKI